MTPEVCAECGFDGADWSDADAAAEISSIPHRWRTAVGGIDPRDLQRRPIATMWSMAEYTDHLREVFFGLRFLLDTALREPGKDVGVGFEPRFEPEPRAIDFASALAGLSHEAHMLSRGLSQASEAMWVSTATVGGQTHDVHWIARHALHDATHHLLDLERLKAAL